MKIKYIEQKKGWKLSNWLDALIGCVAEESIQEQKLSELASFFIMHKQDLPSFFGWLERGWLEDRMAQEENIMGVIHEGLNTQVLIWGTTVIHKIPTWLQPNPMGT